MDTFGSRLRAARNAIGMTQQRLGDALGVSKGAVSRWESGIDQPQFALLPALRERLRVSLDYLVCGASAKPSGVAEAVTAYDLIDDEERRVLASLRRMSDARKAAAISFLTGD